MVAGVAVGGIAAVVFLLLLILVILLFLRRWHKHQKERFTGITARMHNIVIVILHDKTLNVTPIISCVFYTISNYIIKEPLKQWRTFIRDIYT